MNGLRARVNRISHLVVNVSDLDRSRRFYEATTPLRVYRRTTTPSQPFLSLGIPMGRFDGYLMADGTAGRPGVMVHLVQWQTPAPVGHPYPSFFSRGLYRFCFLTSDIEARYREVTALGHRAFLPPRGHGVPVPGGSEGRSFVLPDPDGVPVQLTRRPGAWRPDLPDQLYHVNLVSAEVDRSRRFLEEVVGLEYVKRLTLPGPVSPIGFGVGADTGQFDAAFLWHRGDQRFSVDVVNWFVPGVTGSPYDDPTNLGIRRLGFEVDDLDAALTALRAVLPTNLLPTVRGPESWDLGDAGTHRVAVFQDHDGVDYELVEQDPFPDARDRPWPAHAFSAAERDRPEEAPHDGVP